MKLVRRVASILALIVLFNMNTVTVFANSAQRNWEGIYSTGTITTDENCPIVVEKELLTFDIYEFPKNYYDNPTDYLSYSSTVTANYAFYNPADYTVTATLVFPFGASPSYGFDFYDEEQKAIVRTDSTKFDIIVDGKTVAKKLRHTLFYPSDQFELSEDMAMLHDDFIEDSFYSPKLTVTRYTYTVSSLDEENFPAASAALDIPPFDGKRKVFLAEQSGLQSLGNDGSRISIHTENGGNITLYVIGAPFTQDPEWTLYKDGGTEDGEEIDGEILLTETTEMSFKEFALTKYSPDSEISETDWYNAIVTAFSCDYCENESIITYPMDNYDLDISQSLMRWYEYKMTFEPGQRLINTVKAPVYPSIDGNYEPIVFGYTYLLSPAQTWAEFGGLDIVINTPFFITSSSLDGFAKTEYGYSLTVDSLPQEELSFTLCASGKPIATQHNYIVTFAKISAAIIISGAIIVFIVKRCRKKHKSNR